MTEKEFIELQGKKVEFRTQWRQEVIYSKKLYLRVGSALAKQLLKTGISANQVTFVRLIIGLVSMLFFLNIGYPYLVAGMVIFQVSMIFDCADGTIARTKGSAGNYGKFIELNIDRFVESLLFIVITYVVYVQTGNPLVWIIGMFSIGLESLIVTHKFGLRFLYSMPSGELRETIKKRNFLLGIFTYTSFNRHFLLIFFVIFNQLFWYMVIVAFYYLVFYMAMLAFSHKKLRLPSVKKVN